MLRSFPWAPSRQDLHPPSLLLLLLLNPEQTFGSVIFQNPFGTQSIILSAPDRVCLMHR